MEISESALDSGFFLIKRTKDKGDGSCQCFMPAPEKKLLPVLVQVIDTDFGPLGSEPMNEKSYSYRNHVS